MSACWCWAKPGSHPPVCSAPCPGRAGSAPEDGDLAIGGLEGAERAEGEGLPLLCLAVLERDPDAGPPRLVDGPDDGGERGGVHVLEGGEVEAEPGRVAAAGLDRLAEHGEQELARLPLRAPAAPDEPQLAGTLMGLQRELALYPPSRRLTHSRHLSIAGRRPTRPGTLRPG